MRPATVAPRARIAHATVGATCAHRVCFRVSCASRLEENASDFCWERTRRDLWERTRGLSGEAQCEGAISSLGADALQRGDNVRGVGLPRAEGDVGPVDHVVERETPAVAQHDGHGALLHDLEEPVPAGVDLVWRDEHRFL